MTYEIKIKKNFLGFSFTKKIKNVTMHAFPSDFNNDGILMVAYMDGRRELINIKKYLSIEFPPQAFLKPEEQKNNLNKEQKDLLKKI